MHRTLFALLTLTAAVGAPSAALAAEAAALRVCAEPANFPVSDHEERGFENRIARLIADDLGLALRYTWHPQWRGFVRKTIGAGQCDVWIGVPAGFERVLTTRPYFRSAYVFVSDARTPPLRGFDDPRLHAEPVGVPRIAGDITTTPAGLALAPHGPAPNVVGYSVYEDTPASARMVADVATGRLAVAVLWGPQAGDHVRRSAGALKLDIARPPPELAHLPFEYDIAIGVRKGERALRDRLDAVLQRRRADIDAILAEFGVPRTDADRPR